MYLVVVTRSLVHYLPQHTHEFYPENQIRVQHLLRTGVNNSVH